MNRFNLLRRLVGGISVVAIAAIATFSGCTNANDYLGSNLILKDQAMKLGQLTLNGIDDNCDYFESRLYKTDSINTANLSAGFFGTMADEVYGSRSASFFSQYIVGNTLNKDAFGYMPIFDSAVLYLSISNYGGDTTVSQEFEVFEVVDNSFLEDSADDDQSVFFPTFDIEPYVAKNPVFTFKFPDVDNGVFTSASYVTMQETEYTKAFMDRLMLITDDDQEIYRDDEKWIETFKGLYVKPKAALQPVTANSAPGAIYETTLSSSGFGFFGRNREEADHTLIKDTIGMTYSFYSDYSKVGNQSINMFDYDYDGSEIVNIKTPETVKKGTEVPETSILRIEGMAGVVSEITLTEALFKQLDAILAKEEAESGDVYTSLFFNQAKLKIYMTPVDGYDPANIDPYVLTPLMDDMPTKLGLYSNYSNYYYEKDGTKYTTFEGVADYIYSSESQYTLDFGGALNRSLGCYVLNIPGSIQMSWNSYLEEKAKAEEAGTEIDWDAIKDRTVYLGQTATNLYSTSYASLQAGDIKKNSAPMYLELTYTMIR